MIRPDNPPPSNSSKIMRRRKREGKNYVRGKQASANQPNAHRKSPANSWSRNRTTMYTCARTGTAALVRRGVRLVHVAGEVNTKMQFNPDGASSTSLPQAFRVASSSQGVAADVMSESRCSHNKGQESGKPVFGGRWKARTTAATRYRHAQNSPEINTEAFCSSRHRIGGAPTHHFK